MDKSELLAELRRLVSPLGKLDFERIESIALELGWGDRPWNEYWQTLYGGSDVSDDEWRERFGEHALEVAIAVQAAAIERMAARAGHESAWVLTAHRRVRRLDPH